MFCDMTVYIQSAAHNNIASSFRKVKLNVCKGSDRGIKMNFIAGDSLIMLVLIKSSDESILLI